MDTLSPPSLFFMETVSSNPITSFEKEVFLTTSTGQPVKYTIRAYPNQRAQMHLHHPPLHGKVEFKTDRTFEYKSRRSFKGIDTFSCLLQNGLGQVIAIPFTVVVNSDFPKQEEETEKRITAKIKSSIPATQFSTYVGKKLVKDIPLFEETEDPYTVELKKPAGHGRVDVYIDGTFEYTPFSTFQGKDSFEVSQHFSDGDVETIAIDVLVVKPIVKKPNPLTNKSKRKAISKKR